jgi:hypothetical protein
MSVLLHPFFLGNLMPVDTTQARKYKQSQRNQNGNKSHVFSVKFPGAAIG